MVTFTSVKSSRYVYRVDKFKVPSRARKEFLDKVRETHAFLRTLPGLVEDFVLEQTAGPGAFNFVAVAVWKNAEAVDAARQAVAARHKATGFDRQRLFVRFGIEADLANYRRIGV